MYKSLITFLNNPFSVTRLISFLLCQHPKASFVSAYFQLLCCCCCFFFKILIKFLDYGHTKSICPFTFNSPFTKGAIQYFKHSIHVINTYKKRAPSFGPLSYIPMTRRCVSRLTFAANLQILCTIQESNQHY